MLKKNELEELIGAVTGASHFAANKARDRWNLGYRGWNDPAKVAWLFERLRQEVGELGAALVDKDFSAVADECLDVINFAAFIRHCVFHPSPVEAEKDE